MQAIMVECGDKFWMHRELQLSMFEGEWYKKNVINDNTDYSMSKTLTGDSEKVVGNHLILSGPLVDSYLKQVGNAMSLKLSRKTTGLATPINVFIPWQVANHILSICTGYGAEVKVINDQKNKNRNKVIVFIAKEDSAQKIFNPKRFDGTYFLTKRKYSRVKLDLTLF